ncbi:hypothetical protein CG436_01655 [Pantoea ananatis]|nr:hypothetical protein CG436_01655 [Pantoea ananatis]
MPVNIRSPAPLCYLRHPHNTSMPSLFFPPSAIFCWLIRLPHHKRVFITDEVILISEILITLRSAMPVAGAETDWRSR